MKKRALLFLVLVMCANLSAQLPPPTLLSPPDVAVGIATDPLLSWDPLPGAVAYRVHVATQPDFSDQLIWQQVNPPNTSYQVTGLNNNQTYYWRVRGWDTGPGTFAPRSFTTKSIAPVIISPVIGVNGISLTPELVWAAAPDAVSYDLEISTVPDFSTILISQAGIVTTNFQVTVPLAYNTLYYWRVKANTAISFSDYTEGNFYTKAEAPVLLTPLAGATAVAVSPLLTWNASPDAIDYYVQVSAVPDFSTALISTLVGNVTSYQLPLTLQYVTQYYWRVYAVTSNSYSDWSSSDFTTETAYPILLLPADNLTNATIEPLFTWVPVSNALDYGVEVSTSPTFATLAFPYAILSGTSFQSPRLANETKYYWRVKAWNGTTLTPSPARSFTTCAAYPVTLGWPVGNPTMYTRTPQVTWYHMGYVPALKYDVLFSVNADMSAAMVVPDITGTIATLPQLLLGTKYYWQVRTKLPSGAYSAYSPIESFTVYGSAGGPLIPNPSWPVNNATIYTSTTTLSWWLGGISSGDTYEVLYTVNGVAQPAITGITTTFTEISVVPGAAYTWKVRTMNGTQTSEWSTVATFITAGSVTPIIPVAGWPVGGSIIYNNPPTLYWYLSGLATGLSYEIAYGTDNTFTSVTVDQTTDPFYAIPAPLASGTYFWRVRSFVGTNYSNWSETASFVIQSLGSVPLVPTCAWPIDGATVYAMTQSLYWYVSGYVGSNIVYDVEIRAGALTGTPTNTDVLVPELAVTLLPGTTYNWAVRTRIAGSTNASAWSAPESFVTITGTSTLSKPIASWPVNNAMVVGTDQTLYWYLTSASTGLTYRVEFADNNTFTGSTFVPATAQYLTLTGLTQGTTYYWRVQSFDGTLYSAASDVESFTVINPAGVYTPLIGSPSAGVIAPASNLQLSWAALSSAAASYELIVSDNPAFTNGIVMNNITGTSATVNGLNSNKQYYWKVRTVPQTGTASAYSSVGTFFTGTPTDVVEEAVIPEDFSLEQNYPNPFNPSTSIRFALPQEVHVSLTVFDATGKHITTLVNEMRPAGLHEVTLNGADLSSGVYFYQMRAGSFITTKKLLLLK